jgi:hypothetical protein
VVARTASPAAIVIQRNIEGLLSCQPRPAYLFL